MIDTPLKTQLEKATLDLDKTTDVEGILIVARDGRILHHNLRVDVDINLFGPMSQVISNSSHRLLSSSGQGELERVLVESSGGKALFLGLKNAHLIILMLDSANVGLVMVNAKRASKLINEVTQDLELEVPAEIPEKAPEKIPETTTEEIPTEQIPETTTEEIPTEKIPETTTEEIPTEKIPETTTDEVPLEEVAEISETETVVEEVPEEKALVEGIKAEDEAVKIPEEIVLESEKHVVEEVTATKDTATKLEAQELEKPAVDETIIEDAKPKAIKTEPQELKPPIPSVKPPISFPSLPKDVQVSDEPEKRSELILDIYEAIFLAMALGAAKIMGVAPARGLTKQFLPFKKCQRLLHNVELKSNATIDFAQIKENAAEIPLNEREKVFIQDFSRMIDVITENYGRVMGYEAFRGMVRTEFLEIKKSYGNAMDVLNIKEKIHPEIAQLFN
ncbi:roadblock/LC7 domain-containing protein [Methanobacterium sp. MZD130B]|jgi:predicted regulator of Ras-like GTPase activity (Roadblock/LC7/MglB family)|uniref:roadblock/LC7 domain-containing protein n=1 Tax=Methanobacterium sp. MZD130B TaxID=3394378 RepID=UPI0039FC7E53